MIWLKDVKKNMCIEINLLINVSRHVGVRNSSSYFIRKLKLFFKYIGLFTIISNF